MSTDLDHLKQLVAQYAQARAELETAIEGLRPYRAYYPAKWAEGLALLAEIVACPRFDEADVARVLELRRSRLRQLRTVPGAVADRVFLETLYPSHPYGHLGIGTTDSLSGLTAAHVRQFHRDAYQLGPATLIAVGALTHDRFIDAAEWAFGEVPVRSAS